MAAPHRSDGPKPPVDSVQGSVLSLTKYIPYPLITHAGGQYVLAHDRALAGTVELRQLAPDIPLNREALPRVADGPPAALLTEAKPRLRGLALKLARLESVWAGSSVYWPVRRLFRGPRGPWHELEQADAVELQWSEMMALAPLIRRRLPRKPLIGIAHDVITQRLERQTSGQKPGLRRALLRLAAKRARAREAESFRAVDMLLVFSEKDAVLARELAPGTRVEVVHPGLGPTDPLPRSPHVKQPIVLFTGAMNRPENAEAVSWFIDEIWPKVLHEVPNARFVIAGANPSAALGAKVSATHRAELTGFVESLEPWYAEASVFVAPLRSGAGVKFKTIDAMLRGVPIVTTGVGAEGIDAQDLFASVTDNAARFAESVIEQLQRPDVARTDRAREWADQVYGISAFETRIRGLYIEVVAGARAADRSATGSHPDVTRGADADIESAVGSGPEEALAEGMKSDELRRAAASANAHRARVVAVISAFRPEPVLVQHCASLAPQVSQIIVVDDGSGASARPVFEQLEAAGVTVIGNSKNSTGASTGTVTSAVTVTGTGTSAVTGAAVSENLGIAAAMNRGADTALAQGAEFVITFDQDSEVPEGFVDALVDEYDRATAKGLRVGMVAPEFFSATPQTRMEQSSLARSMGVLEAYAPIQSGLLMPADVIREIGPQRDDYFIDLVDTEYFLRARRAGFSALCVPGLVLPHGFGHRLYVHLLGRRLVKRDGRPRMVAVSSPFRYYYRARNRVVLNRAYGKDPANRALLRRDTVNDIVLDYGVALWSARGKFALLTLLLAGWRDGLRGRLGKMPEKLARRAAAVRWKHPVAER